MFEEYDEFIKRINTKIETDGKYSFSMDYSGVNFSDARSNCYTDFSDVATSMFGCLTFEQELNNRLYNEMLERTFENGLLEGAKFTSDMSKEERRALLDSIWVDKPIPGYMFSSDMSDEDIDILFGILEEESKDV